MRTNTTLVAVALTLALAAPAFATLDLNHDGVSDIWAQAYPTVGAPDADPDGDGATNLAESLAGTNPLDPASHFAAVPRRTAAGALELHWPGVAGKRYHFESSTDLRTWTAETALGELSGSGSELTQTVLAAGAAAPSPQFWRVVALDADQDSDGLTDWEEARLGTSPTLADTDHDGMADLWEVAHGLNPLVNDAAADPDGDGFSNAVEYAAGTDPTYHALPVAGGPVAFWVSQPIRPDETLLITAGGIDLGAQLDLAALPNDDPGSPLAPAASPTGWTLVKPLTATPRGVTATVPADWNPGVYALRLREREGSATGPVRLVNAPDPWFVQGDRGDTATPGGFFIVAGTCLEQLGGVGPRAALVRDGKVEATLALLDRLTTSTGYGLRFAVPASVPEGDYTLYLHNGCGGPAGWVKFKTFITAPLETVTVRKPVVWPTTTINVNLQSGANDDERFAAAIAAVPAAGGTIYVPAGTYTLTQQLELPHHTLLQGAGRTRTLLRWSVDPGKPLVIGKFVSMSPEYTRACFAIEDLSIQASADFRRRVVERIATREFGWIRRVGVTAPYAEKQAFWGNVPTAIYLESVDNTVLEDLVLDSYFCVQAGNRTAYLRLVDSSLNWFDKTLGVDGRCHNLVVANNHLNQHDNPESSDVGLNFTTNFGDWWMGGPYTRDLLWTGNASSPDPSGSPHQGGYTSDSPAGIYLGKIASVHGTTLNLAGLTRVPINSEGKPVYAYNWAGGIAQILGGRGAGQWRYLAVAGPGQQTVQIDRPWDVEPDDTSTVGLVCLQGRLMIIDNDFAQEPESQDFYLTLDVLKAGNKLGVEGGKAWFASWSGFDLQCTAPAWHTQILDNTVVRGLGISYTSMVINLEGADYSGVVGAGHVYRNNKNFSGGPATLYLGSRDNDFADVVIEHNHLDEIALQGNSSERIALSGVLFRANTTATGTPTPIEPAGTTPGATVAE